MATVTTVTPTTTVRNHAPGIPDSGAGNIAGEIDLGTVEGWTFLASFACGGLELTYNSGAPSVDIAKGRVARTGDDGTQELITISAESGISLASSSDNYIYFKGDNDYEVRDADTPPGPDALLIGTIDTSNDVVRDNVRGRSPISQFASVFQDSARTIVASGAVALSSGVVSIDTGVASSETATFYVALGPDTQDAEVAADIRDDSGSSTYQVDIQETDTSVGNPTVNYDVERVR